MGRFQENFSLTAACQLTRLERQVVLNIGYRSAAPFRDALLTYLQGTTWSKSPFSNEALSSASLSMGWTPKQAAKVKQWKERVTTSEESLSKLFARWVSWHEGLPDQLRHKKQSSEVEEDSARCALYMWVLAQWRRDTPASVFAAIESEVDSQFMTGFLDEQLDDCLKLMSPSWMYTQLPIVMGYKDKQSEQAAAGSGLWRLSSA